MTQQDISIHRFTDGKLNLRRFHQARWDEPIVFELSREGQRGILVPEVEEEMRNEVGDVVAALPEAVRRKQPPKLPELSQPQVVRHYLRLSQENLGADLNIEAGQGTCTMKYSPKINDQLASHPKLAELHPLQDEGTVQGILEIMYRFEQILKQISGMNRFTLQPAAGSAAIYTNASIIRAYHESQGETCHSKRDGWHDYSIEVASPSDTALSVGIRGLYVSSDAPTPYNNAQEGTIGVHSVQFQRKLRESIGPSESRPMYGLLLWSHSSPTKNCLFGK